MKIINKILLLSLIFVISCDKDSSEVSFSIVGEWSYVSWTDDGGSNWMDIENGGTYNFKSNGTYIHSSTVATDYTLYYELCESSNVIQTSGKSFNGNCKCESPNTNDRTDYSYDTEGSNTMIWLYCGDDYSNIGIKFIRL